MAQFHLENSQSPPVEPGLASCMPEALRRGAPVGPRLVGGTSFAGKSALDRAQIQLLAQACLQGLDAARQVVFGWQRQGQSLEDIYIQGITPCARLLGEWWCADRLDFAMTTIASTHLQQLLYDFSAEFLQEAPQARNGWSLLLLTEPGAQHSMGLFMLSEFFKRAGWTVTVGVPQDVAEFKRLFQSDWFDAVGISVSTDRHLDTLANLLPQLKAGADNLGVRLFLGGGDGLARTFAPARHCRRNGGRRCPCHGHADHAVHAFGCFPGLMSCIRCAFHDIQNARAWA